MAKWGTNLLWWNFFRSSLLTEWCFTVLVYDADWGTKESRIITRASLAPFSQEVYWYVLLKIYFEYKTTNTVPWRTPTNTRIKTVTPTLSLGFFYFFESDQIVFTDAHIGILLLKKSYSKNIRNYNNRNTSFYNKHLAIQLWAGTSEFWNPSFFKTGFYGRISLAFNNLKHGSNIKTRLNRF